MKIYSFEYQIKKISFFFCVSLFSIITFFSCFPKKIREVYTSTILPAHLDPICKKLGQKSSTSLNLYAQNDQLSEEDSRHINERISQDYSEISKIFQPTIIGSKKINFSKERSTQNLRTSESNEPPKIAHIDFRISDVPLCLYEITAYEIENNINYLGKAPVLSSDQNDKFINRSLPNWPSPENSIPIITRHLLTKYQKDDNYNFLSNQQIQSTIIDKKKCLDIDSSGQLIPYWKFNVEIHGKPFYAISNKDQILRDEYGPIVYPLFFDLGTKGSAWKLNTISTSEQYNLEEVELPNASNSEYLCNSKFWTGYPKRNNNHFIYSYKNTKEINEITLFKNANIHANWITQFTADQTWHWDQIFLIFHNEEDNPQNYLPLKAEYNHSKNKSTIYISKGTAGILVNLAKDPDVISHELGHHIIFKYIYNLNTEGSILHEGIADFFVYARTENPCLASTICPRTSPSCIHTNNPEQSCLRKMKNEYTFSNFPPNQSSKLHKVSQIVSGFLSELGDENKIGLPNTMRLVLLTLEILPSNARFIDFINGLIASDEVLFKNKNHGDLIKSVATSRGFYKAKTVLLQFN